MCSVKFETKSVKKDAFDWYKAPYTLNMNECLLNMWAANNGLKQKTFEVKNKCIYWSQWHYLLTYS